MPFGHDTPRLLVDIYFEKIMASQVLSLETNLRRNIVVV